MNKLAVQCWMQKEWRIVKQKQIIRNVSCPCISESHCIILFTSIYDVVHEIPFMHSVKLQQRPVILHR